MERKNTKPAPSLESAIVIGYSVGLRTILGVGSQAMSNVAGKYVGKEIALLFKSNVKDLGDVERVLRVFGYLKLEETDNQIVARISNCKICPKRVGSYEFEGTACPWGGILLGFLEECFGKSLSMNVKLKPGEVCEIVLKES